MKGVRLSPSLKGVLLALIFAVVFFVSLRYVMWSNYDDASRQQLADRLGISRDSSWEELETFFDCQYIYRNIHFDEMLSRLSKIDSYLVNPGGVDVNYSTNPPRMNLKLPDTLDVYHENYNYLSRRYGIDGAGHVQSSTALPQGPEGQSSATECNRR